jgi:hypothetical protein
VKITLTIFAFLAGWALFVIVGNSWTTLAVAASFADIGVAAQLVGMRMVGVVLVNPPAEVSAR